MNKNFRFYIIIIVISFTPIHQCIAQIGNKSTEVNTQSQMQYINRATFQEMTMLNNVSDDILYKIIEDWVVSTYNTSSEVLKYKFENRLIQVVGIEPGIVLFKFPRTTASLKYTLNLEVENNKLCFTCLKWRS